METVALIPLNPPAPQSLLHPFARCTVWRGPAVLKLWHLTSLDAPTVAVVWACAFAWAARVRVAPAMLAVLALVVWAIYVFDRLLDARAGRDDPGRHILQERHWFHWRHRRAMSALAGAAAIVAGCMVEQRLAMPALRRDSLMGLATLAYFSGVHGRGLRSGWIARVMHWLGRVVSREVVVGVIFSAGCMLPVLPSAGSGVVHIALRMAAPALTFAGLAWLNLAAIGRWEAWAAGSLRDTGVARLGLRMARICALCGLAAAIVDLRVAMLLAAAALSALMLAGLDARRERMDAVTLRAAADLMLLTPVLLTPIVLAMALDSLR